MKENATGSWASRKFLFSCTVLHTNSSLHTEMNRIWMYFIEFFVKSTKLTFQICFSFYSIKKASISTVAIWTSALRNTMKILGPCFFNSYTSQNKLAIMDLVFQHTLSVLYCHASHFFTENSVTYLGKEGSVHVLFSTWRRLPSSMGLVSEF